MTADDDKFVTDESSLEGIKFSAAAEFCAPHLFRRLCASSGGFLPLYCAFNRETSCRFNCDHAGHFLRNQICRNSPFPCCALRSSRVSWSTGIHTLRLLVHVSSCVERWTLAGMPQLEAVKALMLTPCP
eukprot:3138635-Rhodomonas_salina.5